MPTFSDPLLNAFLLSAFVFACFTFIANRIAKKKGYYTLPADIPRKIPLRFVQVCAVFGIFLLINYFLLPFLSYWMSATGRFSQANLQDLIKLHFFALLLTFICLGIYLFSLNRSSLKRLFKDKEYSSSSLRKDALFGMLTYLIAFPLIVVISEVIDLFLYLLLHVTSYEQAAVFYLRLAQDNPLTLCIALFTIVCGAPLIEELLFRGFLQTWLKNKMGRKASLTLSSLAFALFHIAPSQGYGNITLFFSLFAFGLYLGFVYERQRSLLAPIVLHALFNTVSTIRILTFME